MGSLPRPKSASKPDRLSEALEILRGYLDKMPDLGVDDTYQHEPSSYESKWGFIMAGIVKRTFVDMGVAPQRETTTALAQYVVREFSEQEDPEVLSLEFTRGWRACVLPWQTMPDEYALYFVRSGQAPMVPVDRARYPSKKWADSAALFVSWYAAFEQWRADNPHEKYPTVFIALRRASELLGGSREYWRQIQRLLVDEGALKLLRAATPREAARYTVVADPSERQPLARGLEGLEGLEVLEVPEGHQGHARKPRPRVLRDSTAKTRTPQPRKVPEGSSRAKPEAPTPPLKGVSGKASVPSAEPNATLRELRRAYTRAEQRNDEPECHRIMREIRRSLGT